MGVDGNRKVTGYCAAPTERACMSQPKVKTVMYKTHELFHGFYITVHTTSTSVYVHPIDYCL